MKLLPILFLALLIASAPAIARGIRCTTTKQCAYMSVCDGGYCMTMEEMFEKYGFDDGQGSRGRGKRSLETDNELGGNEELLKESGSQDDQEEPHPRIKRSSQAKGAFDGVASMMASGPECTDSKECATHYVCDGGYCLNQDQKLYLLLWIYTLFMDNLEIILPLLLLIAPVIYLAMNSELNTTQPKKKKFNITCRQFRQKQRVKL